MSEMPGYVNTVRLKCDLYSANLTIPLIIHSTKYLLGMRPSARDRENRHLLGWGRSKWVMNPVEPKSFQSYSQKFLGAKLLMYSFLFTISVILAGDSFSSGVLGQVTGTRKSETWLLHLCWSQGVKIQEAIKSLTQVFQHS